jgi:hypothetical protein
MGVTQLNRKEADMRSAFAVLVLTGALALTPAVAQADFPEQPGDHVATGCANIPNQGTLRSFGPTLEADDGLAPAATEARISQMYIDACLE